jgi:hypothetical protein
MKQGQKQGQRLKRKEAVNIELRRCFLPKRNKGVEQNSIPAHGE